MAEKEENTKSDAALREERVLEFWKENKIFEKSLERTEGKKEFIFYDGPVTANSKPVLHTMVPFSFKDGIAKFNKECRESVWEYVEFWKNFTNRMGYWADQENAYVTYHNNYIESAWNIVKKINEQKLLYKDYKVVPWCPRCGTALSSHELAQGYEDVKDLSITAKFKIVGQENTYILAWTTTPWTLPGNLALAVGEDIDYVKVKSGKEIYILAKNRLSVLAEPYEILTELKGKDLIGLRYEPLFLFYKNIVTENEKIKLEKAYT